VSSKPLEGIDDGASLGPSRRGRQRIGSACAKELATGVLARREEAVCVACGVGFQALKVTVFGRPA
jgi:hypothetical protein